MRYRPVLAAVLAMLCLSLVHPAPARAQAPVRATVPNAAWEGAVEPTLVHFFVVPLVLPDGRDAAEKFPDLKRFLIKLAGGYTQLGAAEGGWLDPRGQVETERNVTFMVAAPRDISAELVGHLKTAFKVREAFVLVYEAKRTK